MTIYIVDSHSRHENYELTHQSPASITAQFQPAIYTIFLGGDSCLQVIPLTPPPVRPRPLRPRSQSPVAAQVHTCCAPAIKATWLSSVHLQPQFLSCTLSFSRCTASHSSLFRRSGSLRLRVCERVGSASERAPLAAAPLCLDLIKTESLTGGRTPGTSDNTSSSTMNMIKYVSR